MKLPEQMPECLLNKIIGQMISNGCFGSIEDAEISYREIIKYFNLLLTYRPASEMPENKQVLLYSPDGGFFIGYKYMGKIEIFPRDSRFDKLNFSHYLELPEPPKELL